MRMLLSLFLLLPLFACNCEGDGGLHQKKADITVTPNPLVFDTVPRNTTASKLLHIENPGDLRLDISSITIEEGAGEGFQIAGETAIQVEPGASHDLEVRFSASDLQTAEGTLLIVSNADQKAETRVTLQATRRQGPVLVVCVESVDIPLGLDCGSPSTIDFGNVRIDETREALITLRSEGTDAVSVSSVSFAGHPSLEIDAPELPVEIAVGELVQVPVRFTPAVQEQIEGTVSIQSNDTLSPDAQVALRGRGAELGLCIEPAVLAFGGVRLGTSKELPLRLSNCGSAAIDITGAEIYLGGSELELVEDITDAITLPPQEGLSFELKVRYTPANEGEDEGRLRITTSNGTALVHMNGDSHACQLAVTPTSLNYQWDPNAGDQTKNVLIENHGSEACTVTRIEMTEGSDEGFVFLEGFSRPPGEGFGAMFPGLPIVLEPTESLTVPIAFWPANIDSSTVSGTVEIEVAERDELYVVDLNATIELTGPCEIVVSPEVLSYGAIGVGQRRTLGANLRTGDMVVGPCKLETVRLLDDSGGAYVLEADPPDVVWGQAVVFVEFAPQVAGIHQGTLEIVTGGDTPQTFTVGLAGSTGASGICVEPRDLPFGDRSTPGTLDFNISACGTETVTVSALDWTTPDAELSLSSPPALPFTLAAGETRTITVGYDPQDQTGDTGILTVRSNDPLKPAVEVRATGGVEIVPPAAGRFLYYWQIVAGGDIMRQPLQGDLTSQPYWGERAGHGCAGCHQLAPDGKYLAVTALSGGGRGISVVDVEANALANAPGSTVDAFYMSWNPDVNTNPPYQYVYSAEGDLHISSLYTGYIGPVQGASDPNTAETMPSWGPDGQIAFVRYVGDGGIGIAGPSSIELVDEAGGVATPLAGASNNNFANYYPRYSPNGIWIAYTLSESAQSSIVAADAQIRLVKTDNSGQVLELSALNGGASSYPTWSVNGEFLSFSSNRAGGQGSWDIYIAPIDPVTGADGPAVNVVEANTASFEHSAQWSP